MHRTYDTTGAYLASPNLEGGKTKAFALDCIWAVVCRPKMLHLPVICVPLCRMLRSVTRYVLALEKMMARVAGSVTALSLSTPDPNESLGMVV